MGSAGARADGGDRDRHDGIFQTKEVDLARIIHERFCCKRRPAVLAREASFVNREAQDGMSVSVSSLARYEIRFTRNAGSGIFAASRMNNAGSKRE